MLQAWRLQCGLLHALVDNCKAGSVVEYDVPSYQDFCKNWQADAPLRIGPLQGFNSRGQSVVYVCTLSDTPDEAQWVKEQAENSVKTLWFIVEGKNQQSSFPRGTAQTTRIIKLHSEQLTKHPKLDEAKMRWQVRNTLIEMMTDRNYILYPDQDVSEQDFWKSPSAEQLERWMTLFAYDPSSDQIVVAVYRPRMKLAVVRSILKKRVALKGDAKSLPAKVIAVSPKIVHQVRTYLDAEKSARRLKDFWMFDTELLVSNPRRHVYQPVSMKILDVKQSKALGGKFKLSNLQKIRDDDIMTQYYGAQPGDIFEIVNEWDHVGQTLEYRIVVQTQADKQKTLNKTPLALAPAPMDTSESKKLQEDSKSDVAARTREDEAVVLDAMRASLYPADHLAPVSIPLVEDDELQPQVDL